MKLRWITVTCLINALCLSFSLNEAQSAPDAEPGFGVWQSLSIPAGRAINGREFVGGSISDMAVEEKGSAWIMANQSVFYWNGQEFVKPTGETLYSGQYLTGLYGGKDRPLYATQTDRSLNQQGKIFRLSDGHAEPVTSFFYDVAHEYPGIYVAKTGQLINWGQLFIAAFDGQEWKREEASLGRRVAVLESAAGIHLISNNDVYTVDAHGKITHKELTADPEMKFMTAVQWGPNRALVCDYEHRQIAAFELPEFKPIEISQVHKALGERWANPWFSAADGGVWFYANPPKRFRENLFYRLDPKGNLAPVPGDLSVQWGNMQLFQYPESVLLAQDGSTWFVTDNRGLVQYKDGTATSFNWRDGVPAGGARAMLQDDAGNIFAYFHHAVLMLSADRKQVPLPKWIAAWQEFPLASYRPIQDGEGNLWMALSAEANQISCWTGDRFVHRPAPFDTQQIRLLIADDQQHLLVVKDHQAGDFECFDLGPASNKRFSTLEEGLVAAMRRGARKFYSTDDVSGPFVDTDLRIWYSWSRSNGIRMYNGKQWATLNGYQFVNGTASGAVATSHERHARYDKGILVPIAADARATKIWMYGPDEMMAFEPSVYAYAPEEYLLVDRESQHLLTATFDPQDIAKPWSFTKGEKRPVHMGQYVTRGRLGSYWSSYAACPLYRMFAGCVFRSDFKDTPLAAQDYITRNLFDDRRGNLWIHRGTYWGGGNSVFIKDTQKFCLEKPQIPGTVGKGLIIPMQATDALGARIAPQLLWQIDEGPWIRGTDPGKLVLTFSDEGHHHVRVLGIGPQAEFTAEVLELDCDVRTVED